MSSQEAVRWNIKVSKETDLSLRSFLASQGLKGIDRSKFIEQAVLRQVFQRTIEEIHTRNRDADPEQVAAEIDAALQQVRVDTFKRNSLRQSAV